MVEDGNRKMKAISRSMNLLYPPFAARIEAGITAARAEGLDVYLFEGWRSSVRQGELFAQGRTKPGAIVTRARPGESFHEYGLAGDLAFGGPGKWHWQGDWDRLDRIMRAVDLDKNGRPDLEALSFERPHWQWPGAPTVKEMQAIVAKYGLLSLWQQIESQTKVS